MLNGKHTFLKNKVLSMMFQNFSNFKTGIKKSNDGNGHCLFSKNAWNARHVYNQG